MKKLKLYGVFCDDVGEGVGIAVAYNSRQARSIFYRELNDSNFSEYYAEEIKPNKDGEFEVCDDGDYIMKNYESELSKFSKPGIY